MVLSFDYFFLKSKPARSKSKPGDVIHAHAHRLPHLSDYRFHGDLAPYTMTTERLAIVPSRDRSLNVSFAQKNKE